MTKETSNAKFPISPEMTVLDILGLYRETEKVFKGYDQQAGECICCKALFDPLKDVAERYGLSLKDLNATARFQVKR